MLTIISIIILGTAFYAGYRRGLALQIVYFLGYTLSFMAAKHFYKSVGKKIELFVPYPAPTPKTHFTIMDNALVFDLDKAFYASFGFILVLFVGYLLTKFVGMLCYRLTFTFLLKKGNSLAGALVNTFVTYIGLVLVLTMLSMIPLDFIQSAFKSSSLASFMVEKTPFLSSDLHRWWITDIIK
ncbi:CvpA family protein [Vagococcus jeotgali]|uniref:CvpA family protein n=1 Tax=Vagococcus jeotgali TaxID=3109030 RepID=UPI002DDAD8B0|nr:CvpA family protein [Vagococcus sp. B2T-5]